MARWQIAGYIGIFAVLSILILPSRLIKFINKWRTLAHKGQCIQEFVHGGGRNNVFFLSRRSAIIGALNHPENHRFYWSRGGLSLPSPPQYTSVHIILFLPSSLNPSVSSFSFLSSLSICIFFSKNSL